MRANLEDLAISPNRGEGEQDYHSCQLDTDKLKEAIQGIIDFSENPVEVLMFEFYQFFTEIQILSFRSKTYEERIKILQECIDDQSKIIDLLKS